MTLNQFARYYVIYKECHYLDKEQLKLTNAFSIKFFILNVASF